MHIRTVLSLSFAIALGATACASSNSSGATSAASAPATDQPKSNPNMITAAEIAKANVRDAYDAIQKLRPSMLRPHTTPSGKKAGVDEHERTSQVRYQLAAYADDRRLEFVEQLRQIESAAIDSIRYFSPSDAKFGTGSPGGAIVVFTKR